MNFSKFFLDLFFPKFCLFCQKEGYFLCSDCRATFPVFATHIKKKINFLDDLYFALDYREPRIRFLIKKFKYFPFLKELGQDLSSFLFEHFQSLEKKPDFSDFSVVPIPLEKEREKWRGFNQSEILALEISKFFGLKMEKNLLERKKKTLPQAELNREEREENIKGAFSLKRKLEKTKILLVDDVFTSGATLKEAAKVLKENGAKKVIGIVLAREF
jgi:competence protein ComFC